MLVNYQLSLLSALLLSGESGTAALSVFVIAVFLVGGGSVSRLAAPGPLAVKLFHFDVFRGLW